jgi:hypothetical protein
MDVNYIKVLEFVQSLHSSWLKYNLGGDHFCTVSLSQTFHHVLSSHYHCNLTRVPEIEKQVLENHKLNTLEQIN